MIRLFDLDGTLLDSNEVWTQIDLGFLGRHGLAPTEEYCHTVGHSIFPVAARFTKDYYRLDMAPQAIMDEWMDMAWEAYARHAPLKPGAGEFLARCRERRERMVLLTACVPELCRAALERHGLTGAFERLIFAQEMGLEKREPQVYHNACDLLGVSPADCVFYEDGPGNCAAAKSVGMEVVGVYDPFYESRQEELRRICHKYIRSFEELL